MDEHLKYTLERLENEVKELQTTMKALLVLIRESNIEYKLDASGYRTLADFFDKYR